LRVSVLGQHLSFIEQVLQSFWLDR
jgi:hypothetical protein